MKIFIGLLILVAVAVASFYIGRNTSVFSVKTYDLYENTNLELAARNYPRGVLDIPAQWFMMESLVGWEKMMLIFGYADNLDVCEHLLNTARAESPQRNFRCENAN